MATFKELLAITSETVDVPGRGSAPAVSESGEARLYFDTGTNKLKLSENGGAYEDIATKGSAQTFSGSVTADGLETTGGFKANTTTVSGNYTVLSDDYVVFAQVAPGGSLITLPNAATVGAGQTYVIKDVNGGASSNNITVSGVSSQLIDGSATDVLSTDYIATSYMSTGTAWAII